MYRILIADDHTAVRNGLKKILRSEPDLQVAAEACNAAEVLELLQKIKVDLLLLDISMPGKTGLELLPDLQLQYPDLPVLVLSMHAEDRYGLMVLQEGASGYVKKENAADEIVQAIRQILSGERYMSPALANLLKKN